MTSFKTDFSSKRSLECFGIVGNRDVTITGLTINHDKIPHGLDYRFIFDLPLKPYSITTIWTTRDK